MNIMACIILCLWSVGFEIRILGKKYVWSPWKFGAFVEYGTYCRAINYAKSKKKDNQCQKINR